MKFALTLLITLTLTNCLSLNEPIFAQISQDNEFGKAIMSMIQLQLTNEAPHGQLIAIRDLLAQIQSDLQNQQQSADINFSDREAACEAQTGHLQDSVSTLSAQIGDIETERNELLTEQSEVSTKIDAKRAAIALAQTDLDGYTSQIDNAEQSFQTEADGYAEAIQSCDESVRLLGQLAIQHAAQTVSFAQNGIIFVQMSQKFQAVKNILAKLKSQEQGVVLQPIIDVLVQVGTASKIDSDQLQSIINLITSLRDQLRGGQSLLETSHTTRLQDLENLRLSAHAEVINETANIRSLETRLNAIHSGLAQKEKMFANAQQMLSLKELLLANNQNDCNQMRDNHTAMSAMRSNSLNILDQLLSYFNAKIDASSE